jgi:hypothetical protein
MPLYKNCGRWKNVDCIYWISVKSYVSNIINLSWDKILLTSVINLHLNGTIINFSGTAAQRGLWPSRPRGFLITHNDAPQSVGLLRTSEQLVAETFTWRHTTRTTDKYPCHRWDSNPWWQQGSGRRPTPSTARPLGPLNGTIKSKFTGGN